MIRHQPTLNDFIDDELLRAPMTFDRVIDVVLDRWRLRRPSNDRNDAQADRVAALDQDTLSSLFRLINGLGMTPLVETHSAEELDRALDLGADVVGVNARDLSTFELDQDLFGRLADMIPSGVIRVAESAVKSPADVAHYRRAGADVVLVGEALVTGDDPTETLREFLAV